MCRRGQDKLLDNYLFSLPILFLRDQGKYYPVKGTGDAETLKWLKSQACEGMRVESRLNRSDISSSDKGECLMGNVLHGLPWYGITGMVSGIAPPCELLGTRPNCMCCLCIPLRFAMFSKCLRAHTACICSSSLSGLSMRKRVTQPDLLFNA